MEPRSAKGQTLDRRGPARHPADWEDALVFGDFALRRNDRRLDRDGTPVPLGDKAFHILAALVDRAGQVVGKADLMRAADIQNENSLRFHIVALRRALGEGRFIANVASQGYCFVAQVRQPAGETRSDARPEPWRPLPARARPLFGRAAVLRSLSGQLFQYRFVNLVGPGGVGKTSVALTLARDLASGFDGDVCIFDDGSVFNPEHLEGGLAAALGITAPAGGAAPEVVTFLQRRRMLLVLDGCESALDAAAALAERLFRDAPQIHLLATSREALRAEGEHVHRLFPLDVPASGEGETAEAALQFGAVQLFVDRAAAGGSGFVLTDADASLVSDLCRKLDGLPLAIELAAGRANAFGAAEVARQLDSQFALMWPGRRTAVARHQTLSAALGWSHRQLSDREQIAFRRLSVFAGPFTLAMAADLLADGQTAAAEATALLASLVSKSLVQFNPAAPQGAYRLLDTTRSFALDRLAEANEANAVGERHARLMGRMLAVTPGSAAAADGPRAQDLLGDVGSALEWSLSPGGDSELAVGLAVASAPVWMEAGLMVECRFWMSRVLGAVGPPVLDPLRQLAIQGTLASAENLTDGFTDGSFQSWRTAQARAVALGDVGQQEVSLVVLWAHRIRCPDYPEARGLCEAAAALAATTPGPGTRAMADWMAGITGHHEGRLASGRVCLQRAMADDPPEARAAMRGQFGYDRRVASMSVLSNLHWLEGRPETAMRVAAASVAEARCSTFPVPLCEALNWQALNGHLRGDDPSEIARLLDESITLARLHFIESYLGMSLAQTGLNAVARNGAVDTGLVSQGLELLARSFYGVFDPLFATEAARARVEAGARLSREEMDALLRWDEVQGEHWSSAEVRRNLAVVLLNQGERERAAQFLSEADAIAERQGALAWGLRVAMSAYAAAAESGPRREARDRVAVLLGRFTEGEDVSDSRAARRLLATAP